MDFRAQAGLEYLMTYGWALVLISVVVAVLVFIVGSPAGDATFSSSDPAKVMLKAGAVTDSGAEIRLQNITGGSIEVTDSTLAGAFEGAICTLNDEAIPTGSSSVEVVAGGEMDISCSGMLEGTGTITLQYLDYASLQRQVDITAGGAASGPIGPTDYIAYYAFTEGSGTTARDSAGSNDGELKNFNCVTEPDCDLDSGWISSGHSGNAISLSGVDEEVDCGEGDGITEGVSELTVSGWVYKRSGDTTRAGIGIQSGVWNLAGRGADQYWDFSILTSGGTGLADSGGAGSGMNFDTWTHLAGVYDGTTVKLYVDGVPEPLIGSTTGNTVSSANNIKLGIGAYGSTIDGQIDEVKIWNRALSANEVCSLCNAYSSCSC